MEKEILGDMDLIDLIELYEFISGEMIGNRKMLNWESYFEPDMELVRTTAYIGRLDGEKNELFLQLLGKINFSKDDEDALYDKEQFKDCLEMSNSFDMGIEFDFEKSFKRIEKFKGRASLLLNDLENSKDKINITAESYQKIKKLLEGLAKKNKQIEKEELREVEISQFKINDMKRILKAVFKDSKIIKLFKMINKYKLSKEESEEKCIGINKYYGKKLLLI